VSLNRNFLWQFLNQGLGRGTLFLFFVFLPRAMDFDAYAAFSFTFVLFSTLFLPFMEFGLDLAVVKYASRGETSRIRQAFFWRCVLVAISVPGGLLFALLGGLSVTLSLVVLAYLSLLVMQNLFLAQLRGYEIMHVEGVSGCLQRTFPLFLLWGVPLFPFPGYEKYLPAGILLVAIVFGWGIILLFFSNHVSRLWHNLKRAEVADRRNVFHEGFILGIAALLGSLYFRIDTVMLGFMLGETVAAEYFAATKILETTFVLPYIITLVIFPRLSSNRLARRTQRHLLGLLALLGFSVSVSFYWVAPGFVASFYDPELVGLQPILRVLSLTVIPVYLGHFLTQSLVARDLRNGYIKLTTSGLLLNISVNAVLIPWYGAEGAAWATFCTECLISLGAFILLRPALRNEDPHFDR
jgi:O-antigen/teichoic acid export membrane protein